MFKSYKSQKSLIYTILISFIIAEIIDNILDYLFKNSFIHSIIQILIFLILFLFITKIFLIYHKKKVNELIPDELMKILKIIKKEKENGVLINQTKLMKLLDITKPTMNKRLKQLIKLEYIKFEKQGNNNYIILTKNGEITLIN